MVEALQARRCVQFTVAVTLVAEVGDLTRFDNPRELMKFLGLVPSAYTRGRNADKVPLPKPATAMLDGLWSKAPGPTDTQPKSAGTCN